MQGCGPSMSGQSGQDSRSRVALATLLCSIWRSIASFAAATSSPLRSRMSLQADTLRIAQPSDRKRQDDRLGLN